MTKNNSHNTFGYKLRQFVVSSRPISWINTAFPFVAGYLASGGAVNQYFLLTSFYFLIPYNALIYVINDVFDYESDLRNPRKNSVEGGLLPPETHRFMITATIILNVLVLLPLLANGTATANILLLVIALGAISYSMPPLRLKERPFLDSINSSFHFVSPLVFGLALTDWKSDYIIYVSAFFLWGCASHAFGAVQDIIADREADIASIATYLGAKQTVRLSLGLYFAAGVLLVTAGWPALIMCVPLLTYIGMAIPFINLTDKHAMEAHAGWRRFLLLNQFAGFSVTVILILSNI